MEKITDPALSTSLPQELPQLDGPGKSAPHLREREFSTTSPAPTTVTTTSTIRQSTKSPFSKGRPRRNIGEKELKGRPKAPAGKNALPHRPHSAEKSPASRRAVLPKAAPRNKGSPTVRPGGDFPGPQAGRRTLDLWAQKTGRGLHFGAALDAKPAPQPGPLALNLQTPADPAAGPDGSQTGPAPAWGGNWRDRPGAGKIGGRNWKNRWKSAGRFASLGRPARRENGGSGRRIIPDVQGGFCINIQRFSPGERRPKRRAGTEKSGVLS